MYCSTPGQAVPSSLGCSGSPAPELAALRRDAAGRDQGGGSSVPHLGTVARFVSAGARRFMRQAAARDLVPEERVAICLRRPVPGAAAVEVWRDSKHAVAHYKQLVVCGSVWMCAPCAASITEVRREELSAAVRAWDGQIVLITLTLQHSASDSLSELLQALCEAARKLRQGRSWQDFEDRYGVAFESRGKVRRRIGTVRALEVTHGQNGFHPHLHLLAFLPGGVDVEAFTCELRDRWLAAVVKVGRYASPVWGIDVRHTTAEVADYVAKFGKEQKWTVAHELAKSASKAARADGSSMADLLDAYASGDLAAGDLWREYAECFKGRKQLVWSDGLRALLLPDREELSDEAIVTAPVEEAILLARLDLAAWRVILAHDARYEVLEVASSGDVGELRAFLALLGLERVEVLPNG